MKKLSIAIVGFGGMAHYHAERFKNLGIYEIKGIFDIDKNVIEKALLDGYKVYNNAQEICNDKSVEAVLITTPNDNHIYYTELFAKAKKHILCEKPIGMSTQECTKMYKVARENNVIFMVNQNRRWDKDYLTIKEIIDKNMVGEVYRIESRVMGSNGVPGEWRKELKHGGGMMLDWGVHLIDQLNLLDNSGIEYVYCNMSYQEGLEVEDGFRLDIKFKSGLFAEITVDTNCYEPLPRWLVYGKNGTAVVKNWSLEGGIIYPNENSAYIVEGMKAGNGFTKTMAYRDNTNKVECGLPELNVDGDTLYKNFYNSILGLDTPTVKEEQVRAVFNVMESAFEAFKHGKTIKL